MKAIVSVLFLAASLCPLSVRGQSSHTQLASDFDGRSACEDGASLSLEGMPCGPNDLQLAAHWTFDEGSGDVALDTVGGYDAAVIGPNWVDGILGGALWFDGLDDIVDCGTDPALTPERLTVSAWVRADNVSQQAVIIGKGSDLQVTLCSGQVTFEFGNDDPDLLEFVSVRSNMLLDSNEWHFIAVTRDGTEAILYMDGSMDSVMAYAFPVTPGDLPLKIGEAPFTGTIDDLRIFSKPLDKSDILALMSSVTLEVFLAGHWTFDEVDGDVVFDNAGTCDGIITNAERADGVMGRALHFDGNACVEISTDCHMSPMYMTASLWVMPEEPAFCRILRHETLEDRDYEFFIGDDAMAGFRFGPDDPESPENIRAIHGCAVYHEWNFFAATRDGQSVKFFMQGDLLESQTYTVIPKNPGTLLRLGAKPFKGDLDDVRIYRTALPDKQIQALYESALTPDPMDK